MSLRNISLFIPHVFRNVTQQYVASAFSFVGIVDRVDFVAKQDKYGNEFNAVYVHFKKWYSNQKNYNIQNNIECYGSDKFYYNNSKYYWIICKNTGKKHIPGERKIKIDLTGLHSIEPNTVHPNTPIKPDDITDEQLDNLEAEMEAEMEAEIVKMSKEDKHLIYIDSRYVATIEQENRQLREELERLREEIKQNKENCK